MAGVVLPHEETLQGKDRPLQSDEELLLQLQPDLFPLHGPGAQHPEAD